MAQPSNSCNQQAVPSSLLSAILPQQHQGRQLLQGTPKSVDSQSSQRGHCRNGLPCRLGERTIVEVKNLPKLSLFPNIFRTFGADN